MKTRKIFSIALTLAMLISAFACFSVGASAAGTWDGTTANVAWYAKDTTATEFTISTAEDLYGLSLLVQAGGAPKSTIKADGKLYIDANSKVIMDASAITDTTASVAGSKFAGLTIKLSADIDLNGHTFLPIGSSGSFQGMFDGQNHSISNFKVDSGAAMHASNKTQYYYGLFAYIAHKNGGVKNLTIKNEILNVHIPADAVRVWVGGVSAGVHKNGCTATDVKIEGLTITVTADEGAILESACIGAIYGMFETANEQKNITVTDYKYENLSTYDKVNLTENMYYGLAATTGTGTFTNCSVTVKAAASDTAADDTSNDTASDTTSDTASGTAQNPSNPETGDMTIMYICIAMTAALIATAVIKKKATR